MQQQNIYRIKWSIVPRDKQVKIDTQIQKKKKRGWGGGGSKSSPRIMFWIVSENMGSGIYSFFPLIFTTALVARRPCLGVALLMTNIRNSISPMCDSLPWTSGLLCTQLLHIARLTTATHFVKPPQGPLKTKMKVAKHSNVSSNFENCTWALFIPHSSLQVQSCWGGKEENKKASYCCNKHHSTLFWENSEMQSSKMLWLGLELYFVILMTAILV